MYCCSIVKPLPSQILNAPLQMGRLRRRIRSGRGRDPESGAGGDREETAPSVRCGRGRAPEREAGGRERNLENNEGGIENPRATCAGPSRRGRVRRGRGREAAFVRARGDAAGAGGRARPLSPPPGRSGAAPAPCARGPPAPRQAAAADLPCPAPPSPWPKLLPPAPGGRPWRASAARGPRQRASLQPRRPEFWVRCPGCRCRGCARRRDGRGIGVSCLRSGVRSRGRLLRALRRPRGGRDQNRAAGGGPGAEPRTRPSRSPDRRLRPVPRPWGYRLGPDRTALERVPLRRGDRILQFWVGSNPSSAG